MDKALRYLGLAEKAGRLSVGTEECVKRSRSRHGGLAVLASDAGEDAARQARAIQAEGGAKLICPGYSKRELAFAVGMARPVALAVIWDRGLAEAFEGAVLEERGRQEERV